MSEQEHVGDEGSPAGVVATFPDGVTTLQDPDEVAESLRSAGFPDVRVGADGQVSFTLALRIETWDDLPLYTEPVYHYTSYESFFSIVKYRSLRATCITHLNDAKEVEVGARVVWESVNRIENDEDRELARLTLEAIIQAFRESRIFVFCASKQHQDIPQLDRYGKVVFELDPANPLVCLQDEMDLFTSSAKQSMKSGWREVLYDQQEQARYGDMLLQRILRAVRSHGHSIEHPPHASELCVQNLAHWYAVFVSLCKSSRHYKEEEVRFSVMVDDPMAIEHRYSEPLDCFVPFVTLQSIDREYMQAIKALNPDRSDGTRLKLPTPIPIPIKSVGTGEPKYRAIAVDGMKSFLDREGYGPVPIRIFDNGYRA